MPLPTNGVAQFGLTPRILSTLFIAVFLFLFAVGSARAESFPDSCGGANNFDYATCERLDYLVTQEDDTQRLLSWILGALVFTATIPVWRGVFRG